MTNIVRVGYYHRPSANWSYGIWLVVDETGAKLYKETFGGDSRMIEKMTQQGIKVKEKFGVSAYGLWIGREVNKFENLENYTGKNF